MVILPTFKNFSILCLVIDFLVVTNARTNQQLGNDWPTNSQRRKKESPWACVRRKQIECKVCMKGFINERTSEVLNYQQSLRALLTVLFQDLTMVTSKFGAVICFVYFTFFVNAGKMPTYKTVLQRLDEMESLGKGTFRNVFYFCIERFKSVVFGHCRYLYSEQQLTQM